jgi:ribonucleoside-diphosphate reductase alpha chain
MTVKGINTKRVFAAENQSRTWKQDRRAEVKDYMTGKVIFEQDKLTFPESWSQQAINVVASKFLYGKLGSPERENSMFGLAYRVADWISRKGRDSGYFATQLQTIEFREELLALILGQYGSFNSPVWFNVGVNPNKGGYGIDEGDPAIYPVSELDSPRYQCSACFIVSVEDTIQSISERAVTEMAIFKDGSGAGSDNSKLRSSRERISGGGFASGPVSFMRVYDAVAGVTKSGGKTRRAAKMETIKVAHPDVIEFIKAKHNEEVKANALIAAGYTPGLDGEAYSTVDFQNSNFSVRLTDYFLKMVEEGGLFQTLSVATGTAYGTDETQMPKLFAWEILNEISTATWHCGDPGVQYEDTIQAWHTTPNSGPINSSNPCSEYMSIDDSACNLASINLLMFVNREGFDHERFEQACRVFITAQEIMVDHASYPTAKIARNAHDFRQLGLGYANLGATLMAMGLPYDSSGGRRFAASITSIMGATAYLVSAEIAELKGAFNGFAENREPMLSVINKHLESAMSCTDNFSYLSIRAEQLWRSALAKGTDHGFRNAQVTVLAPTGTIAFMMDCDTTGIEPGLGLTTYKKLAGGGSMKIVNQTVPRALKNLGYSDYDIKMILEHIASTGGIEGTPHLKEEHLPVFDCSFPSPGGTRSIHWTGHLKMMAAVQPFLSGAISKTINMPADSTVEDISNAYIMGWKLGLKAVAIYRDGSKQSQPVSTKKEEKVDKDINVVPVVYGGTSPDAGNGQEATKAAKPASKRERLPDRRAAITHKFSVAGHEGYMTVGMFPDGRPGELFVQMAKEGSTVGGLMDTIGVLVSTNLQYGVPLEVMVSKLSNQRFEPSGSTHNRDIPFASSLVDYVMRWMGIEFIPGYREANTPNREIEPRVLAPGEGLATI